MDKQQLLDALAQSGSAGKAAYDQAQQALAAQQAEAVRMALASGVAGQANTGAQAELQRIVSEPYQTRTAQLTQNQAAMQDWYNRLGAARGAWADQQNALQQYALQQALAQASGGGGGGGGGSTRTPKEKTWEDLINEQFGSLTTAKEALPLEARTAGVGEDWRATGVSPFESIRNYATSEYGVPAATAAALLPDSKFRQAWSPYTNPATFKGAGRKKGAMVLRELRQQAPANPGQYTGYTSQSVKTAATQAFGPKFVKKALKKGK